jgi:protocatechuate 3,4-dioxygenase beta subunit
MAHDVAPQVLLGSVYFEEATGDDSRPDIIEVSFVGGAPGTTLNRLIINGDKQQNGLSEGDVFFDTAAGGLGAFHYAGLSIVSAVGFTVMGVSVVDGGSQIVFDLSGFDAGEKLVFSVDADEVQFIDGDDVDVNSLVEGAEFQRSILVGEFSAPGYVDLRLTALYWDEFDARFAAASTATGLTLALPNDRYSPNHDYSDRTAGAVAHAAQIPLATLSGWVYHDRNDDGVFQRVSEQGIGGVTLELLDAAGNPTGITTTTSSDPDKLGFYEFRNLYAGTYGVREIHPDGWLDGKDSAGSHGGTAADESTSRVDRIVGAVLNFGDHALEYNFGELLPGSIRGKVGASRGPDCNFDNPDIPLAGVRIDLLDAQGNFLRFTLTDANGDYAFTDLVPGIYQVREHQPTDYYDGGERVGTAGGTAYDVAGAYSIIAGIHITSDRHGIQYDFCEKVGVMLSGNVYHDRNNDGNFDRATEEGIGGVVLKLLDAQGNDTGWRATTDANGFYKFNNLPAGTYAVMEIHPAGWLDGIDTPGNLGGVADVSPPGDMISQITINWGQMGTEYNFGELLPGSIRGKVGASRGPDCNFDNPDIPLAGVRIDLLDAQGNFLRFTLTDANGDYAFTDLVPGIYQVREHQPTDYYDGGERVGTAGGTAYDVAGAYSIIAGIHITSDRHGIQYDFCEKVGVMLSGNVYHDRNNDGNFDRATEEGIGGVVLKLLDAQGNDTGWRATTDANGFYKFNNLPAGTYAVMEIHPAGWLDGIDTPGNLGGVADVSPPGDMISQITINWGQMGTEYNFGELLPGSIQGHVFLCDDPSGEDVPIPGVRIDLQDAFGNVLATTRTNSHGEYRFTNLRPGTYRVYEHQPVEYFDGDAHLGSGGGTILHTNLMGSILIGSDQHLVDYDFCEIPPAKISGYVFIDGPPIVTNNPLTPQQIAAQRDGTRTPDDTPLAGVVLELRHGISGEPILVGQALAGHYAGAPDEVIRAVTNEAGYYHFTGLPAGTYAVVQVQPEGVIDSFDRPGTLGGFAVNPIILSGDEAIPSPAQQATIELFREQFGNDAIVRIPLAAGRHSQENNFSEVTTRREPPIVPPVPPTVPPPRPVFAQPGAPYVPPLLFAPIPPAIVLPDIFGGSSQVLGFTWHLSVVNAGWPRGTTPNAARFQLASLPIDAASWQRMPLNQGHWTLATLQDDELLVVREAVFGRPDALAVTGDFNGDGVTDIGLFIDGQWFLDLNGNGVWDENDLWARLGGQDDLPVTGDWDADGKTDIGIYGPAWPRDPWAITREPGLPDAENFPTQPEGKMKNVPPTVEDATDGARVLQRTARGQARADLIDHVFHYGAPADVPVTGDWNGDGVRQIGVFRDGQWNLDMDGDGRFTERDKSFVFGQAGDKPVVGDFNGDGFDEIGVFRAGKWILDTNRNYELDAQDKVFELGGADDQPVVGDWNDDGRDDPGIYTPTAAGDRVARRAG